MLRNLPDVTKNILLLNIMVYVVSLFLASNGTRLDNILGAHYVNSILFEPYQVVTHMFMHSLDDPLHIFFNMFLLVMFGAHLERIWGAKRFFLFYVASGLGAFALYNGIGAFQLHEVKQQILSMHPANFDQLNEMVREDYNNGVIHQFIYPEMTEYEMLSTSTIIGASGALFGLLAGFAMLFPNTQLMLLFPPIPIKAKYLIGGYIIFEVINSLNQPNDHIAHLAHVGGAIVGIIIILIWRRRDRKNFW